MLVLLVMVSLCLVAEKKKKMKEKVKQREEVSFCVVLDLMLNNGKFIKFVIV